MPGGGGTGRPVSKQAEVWGTDFWVLKSSETLGERTGDAQVTAPVVPGETEPASVSPSHEESERPKEEEIYFLMTTTETSPSEACVSPASCERFKACL